MPFTSQSARHGQLSIAVAVCVVAEAGTAVQYSSIYKDSLVSSPEQVVPIKEAAVGALGELKADLDTQRRHCKVLQSMVSDLLALQTLAWLVGAHACNRSCAGRLQQSGLHQLKPHPFLRDQRPRELEGKMQATRKSASVICESEKEVTKELLEQRLSGTTRAIAK